MIGRVRVGAGGRGRWRLGCRASRVGILLAGLLVLGAAEASAQNKCFRASSVHTPGGRPSEGNSGERTVQISFAFVKCSTWSGGLTGISGTASYDSGEVKSATVNTGNWDGEQSTTGIIGGEVTFYGDTDVEGIEGVGFTFSAPGATYGGNMIFFYIADDDSASIEASVGDVSLAEGGSPQTVTVSVSMSSNRVVGATTVALEFSGGATEGDDYTISGDTEVELPARSTAAVTATFVISPVDDAIEEPGGETVIVTAAKPAGDRRDIRSADVAEWTIADNDATAVSLTSSVTELAEGAAATTLQVTATLTGPRTEATLVVLTLGGTATAGVDYAAPGTLPTVTVPVGMTAAMADLVIDPIDDQVYEPGGETIEIGGSAGTLMVTGVTVALADDESAPGVTLTSSVTELAEGAAATTLRVTATLSGAASTETPVALTLAGTATAGTDYTAPGTLPTVTVDAGMTSATVDLEIDPIEDALYEPGGETIEIGGSAGTLMVTGVTVTITDDESAPSVTLTSSVTELAEGASATTLRVMATLSRASSTATAVVLTLAGTATGGVDYTAPGTLPTVTVAAMTTAATVDLVIDPLEDDVYEPGGETIEIGGTAGTLVVSAVVVAIIDDESAPSGVELTANPVVIREGGGSQMVEVTAAIDAVLAVPFVGQLEVGGSARANDYGLEGPTAIEIAAGARTGRAELVITPVDDGQVEGSETITLTLSPSSVAGEVLGSNEVVITILDNDEVVSVASVGVSSRCGTYGSGDVIEIEVVFTGAVVVMGQPRLAVIVGSRRREAEFVGGSGTGRLTFGLQISAPDADADGVELVTDGIELRGGSIRDAAGGDAALAFSAVVAKCVLVGSMGPRIVELVMRSQPAADATYFVDEVIEVGVLFSSGVTLTSSVVLGLTVGTAVRDAECLGAPGEALLVCRYRVVGGDVDEDGVSVMANSLRMMGGSIAGADGSMAVTGHQGLSDRPGHRVSAIGPEVVGVIGDLYLVAGGEVAVVDVWWVVRGMRLVWDVVSSDGAVAEVTWTEEGVRVVSGHEGMARVTVRVSNSVGAAEIEFGVIVSRAEGEVGAWNGILGAIGRSVLRSTGRAITDYGDRRGPGGMRVAGVWVPWTGEVNAGGGSTGVGPRGIGEDARAFVLSGGRQPAGGGGAWSARRDLGVGDAFQGSSFAVGSNDSGSRWGLWGGTERQQFTYGGSEREYSGGVVTHHGGVDVRAGGWVAGVSVGRSAGEGRYRFTGERVRGSGVLDAQLVTVVPYLRWRGPDAEIWGFVGRGWGSVSVDRQHVAASAPRSDARLGMGQLGARQGVGGIGAVRLTLIGDLGTARIRTAGSGVAGGLGVVVSQVRTGVEVAASLRAGAVGVGPFVTVAGRRDAGPDVEGRGVEVDGGVRLLGARGWMEAAGYRLVVHSVSAYTEQGVRFHGELSTREAGRGWMVSVGSHVGSGSAGRVSGDDWMRQPGGARDQEGMEVRVAYGSTIAGAAARLFAGVRHGVDRGVRLGLAIGRRSVRAAETGSRVWVEMSAGWRHPAEDVTQTHGLSGRGGEVLIYGHVGL